MCAWSIVIRSNPTRSTLAIPQAAKLRGMQMVQRVEVETLHFNQTRSTASSPLCVGRVLPVQAGRVQSVCIARHKCKCTRWRSVNK